MNRFFKLARCIEVNFSENERIKAALKVYL